MSFEAMNDEMRSSPEGRLLAELIHAIRSDARRICDATKGMDDEGKQDVMISAFLNVAAFEIFMCCGSPGHIEEACDMLRSAWAQYADAAKASRQRAH